MEDNKYIGLANAIKTVEHWDFLTEEERTSLDKLNCATTINDIIDVTFSVVASLVQDFDQKREHNFAKPLKAFTTRIKKVPASYAASGSDYI